VGRRIPDTAEEDVRSEKFEVELRKREEKAEESRQEVEGMQDAEAGK